MFQIRMRPHPASQLKTMNDSNQSRGEWHIFVGYFLDAAREIPKNRTVLLFALLSVLFGPDVVSLFDKGMPLETFSDSVVSALQAVPLLSFVIFPMSVLSIFFGSGLVISLANGKVVMTVSLRKALHTFRRIYLLEVGFMVIAVTLALILMAPYLLAGNDTPLAKMILLFGTTIYAFILAALFYSRTYAYFHVILSDVSLRTGLDLGYELFRKRINSSLSFGIISIALNLTVSYAMTMLLGQLVMISSHSPARIVIATALSIAMFSYLDAVNRSAWLKLFRYIATQPKPSELQEASQEDEKMIQREIPGTGQASTRIERSGK